MMDDQAVATLRAASLAGAGDGTSGIAEGVLGAIGSTPLVRLRKILPGISFELYGKLEMLNPGGSIKDRPAWAMIEQALGTGRIGPGSVVIESSSGNMAIGLAQACRYHGMRLICVVDPKTMAQNLHLMRLYGAEIEMVEKPDPATGEFLPARLQRIEELLVRHPGAFWSNQYANPKNPDSHYQGTVREIVEALDGRLDYLFVATSTCGTARGCAEFVRDRGLATRVIAVDAFGSLIFSDVKAPRIIPGLGAGLKPELSKNLSVDEVVHINDLDCVIGCRRLLAREALLAGGSSGGVIRAVEHYGPKIPAGTRCAVIFPDRGERYLDTVFDDDWVRDHLGDVEHHWLDTL